MSALEGVGGTLVSGACSNWKSLNRYGEEVDPLLTYGPAAPPAANGEASGCRHSLAQGNLFEMPCLLRQFCLHVEKVCLRVECHTGDCGHPTELCIPTARTFPGWTYVVHSKGALGL